MNTSPAADRYDSVIRSLHWVMAAAMIGLWVAGHMIEILPKGDARSQLQAIHKAVGVIVLVLAVARLAWRLGHTQPPLPASMPPFERLIAHGGHIALYVLMLGFPLEGILMSQSGGREVSVFGLVLPVLLDKNDALRPLLRNGHGLLGWALAVVLVGHVAAALRHQFILKDNIFARMLPSRTGG